MSRVDRIRTGRPGTPIHNGGAAAVKTASGLNIVAAIWLIAAPFLLDYSVQAATWNDIIAGVLILALAWGRVSNPMFSPGLSWTNALLGIWLVLAPFVLRYSMHPIPLWNDVSVGVVVAVLAAWSAMATPQRTVAG